MFVYKLLVERFERREPVGFTQLRVQPIKKSTTNEIIVDGHKYNVFTILEDAQLLMKGKNYVFN